MATSHDADGNLDPKHIPAQYRGGCGGGGGGVQAVSVIDSGATHSVFSQGIHVWYINVVHNPRCRLPVEIQREFLILWRTFNLKGQPL